MNIRFQNKDCTVNRAAWNTVRIRLEFDIKALKSALRKPHTADSAYDQCELVRLRKQATLLYLLRGYCRNRLKHYDSQEKHIQRLNDLMVCWWAKDIMKEFMIEHVAEVAA